MEAVMISKLEALVKELDLTGNGLRQKRIYNIGTHKWEPDTKPAYDVNNIQNQREITECLELIPLLFSKDFARRGCSSYKIKHYLEDFSGYNYISNASTILAFRYLNYAMTKYDDDDLNMNIRATRKYKLLDTEIRQYIQSLNKLAGKTHGNKVYPH